MLTGDLGLLFVVAVVVSLFIGTQVMFEIREDEKRRGINLRC
jgi:D-alanyl-lipoteichoic acid acyltransferase DltB (MBOAT superfamily)